LLDKNVSYTFLCGLMATPKKPAKTPARFKREGYTVLTIALPEDMRKESMEDSVKEGRSESQLWRMAFAYARKIGWKDVPVVP
jgi:hypothetical protein